MRRSQLVTIPKAEKNHRATAPRVIRRSIDEHIWWPEKRLSGFDDELSDLIRATPIWRERDELLRSVPEVGTVLSVTSAYSSAGVGNPDPQTGCRPRWSGLFQSRQRNHAAAAASAMAAPTSDACCSWPRMLGKPYVRSFYLHIFCRTGAGYSTRLLLELVRAERL